MMAKDLMKWWGASGKPYRTISGVPPLTYKAIEGTLKNYRIYGNTIEGESVGDKTENLFDLNTWANTIRSISGGGLMSISGSTVSITSVNATDCYTEPYANSQTGVYKIPVKPNTIYTVNWYGLYYRIIIFENGSLDYMHYFFSDKPQSFTTHSDTTFLTMRFGINPNPLGTTATISDFMLSEGSTSLPYEPYGYKVPVTVSNGTDSQTIPIYLPEQIKKVGEEVEYIDYSGQKQHRVRKNLLQNTATSQTINGVAFTVNDDGSVTCNGKSTSQYYSLFRIPCYLVARGYIISGCPDGGSSGTYCADIRTSPNGGMVGNMADLGAGATIPIDESGLYDYTIRIQGGYTCNNLTFYPMIRKADISDDTYEPYIEDTELDITLPALPTLSGTNILSIGTTVQPSEVYIKGKIKEVRE